MDQVPGCCYRLAGGCAVLGAWEMAGWSRWCWPRTGGAHRRAGCSAGGHPLPLLPPGAAAGRSLAWPGRAWLSLGDSNVGSTPFRIPGVKRGVPQLSRRVMPAPRRADARRNYERLLAAATEVFGERGADAPLDEVARRAGIGNATMYRH